MTASLLLARLAVQALRTAHVRHVIVCPGSRSAPLAYALSEVEGQPSDDDHAVEVHVRHDERVAAFTALGVGRDAKGPAGAVITTSGTAVANLHPAVLEAHHAGVPLVVVTADRPPALRGTWANQTSELQAGLFGDAVRARLDLDDETAAADPDAAWAALIDALQAAYGDAPRCRPGPVHLNLGFTEPLLPAADEPPLPERTAVVRLHRGTATGEWLEPGPRTLVIAGDGADWQARWLAEAAGYPLLAEPSSGGARTGPNLVEAYRLLLDLPELADGIERVVVHGRPTLSRPVTRLLARPDVEIVLASPYENWPNPGLRPSVRRVVGSLAPRAVEPLPKGWHRADVDSWARQWLAAGAAGRAALDGVLDDAGLTGLSGPLVARELVLAADGGEAIVAGSSNAIRDLDLAMPPVMPSAHVVVANRGVAGIDGTMSTAIGVSLARQAPVRALVGDLTFLHDANALLPEPGARRPDVQVVLLNDDGGAIFGLLEHGARASQGPRQQATFERYFGTPHGVDVASLCRAYGVAHVPVADVGALRHALATPLSGISVVEVALGPEYRAGLRALHARIRASVHEAARAALG